MFKKIFAGLLVSAIGFSLVACGTPAASEASKLIDEAESQISELIGEISLPEIPDEFDVTPLLAGLPNLAGASEDHYKGIEIIAAQDRAIPMLGEDRNIMITIKNTGDKDVYFQHGSSSSETPDAFQFVSADGLTVLPASLIETMDFQIGGIKAGETLAFTVNLSSAGAPAGDGDVTLKGAFVFAYTAVDAGAEAVSMVDFIPAGMTVEPISITYMQAESK